MKKWTLEEDNIIRETFNNKLGTKIGAVWILQTILLNKFHVKRSLGAISNRYYSHIKPQDDEDNLINQSKQNINTMKSKIVRPNHDTSKRVYPYIGKSQEGQVVLFTETRTGTLLAQPDESQVKLKIGHYANSWPESTYHKIDNITIEFES